MATKNKKKPPARPAAAVINSKPHLMAKRYTLPDYCSVQSVVMRELDGQDDIEASVWADKNASSTVKESAVAAMVADQRESIRLSLLEVDGKPVNHDGLPFMEMDNWTSRTFRFLMQFYGDLNGATNEDLKNAVTGAELIQSLTPGPGASPEEARNDE
jgi:hypothetical protein